MAKKVNIMYDLDEDILHFFSGEKVKDSIEMDNFVFDISHNGRIIGWQINDASTFLSSIYGKRISKKFISDIQEAYMSNICSKELIFVRVIFYVKTKKGRLEKELTSNIPELAVA